MPYFHVINGHHTHATTETDSPAPVLIMHLITGAVAFHALSCNDMENKGVCVCKCMCCCK